MLALAAAVAVGACSSGGDGGSSENGGGGGILDTTFSGDGIVISSDPAGGTGNDLGQSVAFDGDGNILVAGYGPNASGDSDLLLWRYTPAGALDTTFGVGGVVIRNDSTGSVLTDRGQAVTVDGQGRILVAGDISNAADNDELAVWRFDSTGALDTTFGGGDGIATHDSAAGGTGDDRGYAITVDGQGRILVAGRSKGTVSASEMVLWRFTPTGALDTTFGVSNGYVVSGGAAGATGTGIYDYGLALAVDGSGNILVAGTGRNASSNDDMILWRYTPAGVLDSTFGGDVNPVDGTPDGFVTVDNAAGGALHDYGYGIAVDGSGNILVTGYSNGTSGYPEMVVWRFDPSGAPDTTFGGGDGVSTSIGAAGGTGGDYGRDIALDGQGRILVAGASYNAAGDQDAALWRLNPDGSLDTTYNGTGYAVNGGAAGGAGNDYAYTVAVDGSGRIVLAGWSTNASGDFDMALWRFTSDGIPAAPSGVLDDTFGGDFNPSDGTPDGFVVDDGAAGGTNGGDFGFDVAVDGWGRVLVAGYSKNASNDDDMALWRFDSTGALDTTFGGGDGIVTDAGAAGGTNGNDRGNAVAVDGEGNVLVAGYSLNASGNDDMALWRYDSTGTLDATFGGGSGIVTDDGAAGGTGTDQGFGVAVDGEGKVVVAGYSLNASGNFDMALWRYSTAGVLDGTFGGGDGIATSDGAAGTANKTDQGYAVAIDGWGRILVAGLSRNASNKAEMALWRFTNGGVPDTTFGGGDGIVTTVGAAGGSGDDIGYSVAVDGWGRILVAGQSINGSGDNDMALWRFTADGTLDTTFGGGDGIVTAGGSGYDSGYSVAVDGWGRIVVTGWSVNAPTNFDMTAWRFTADGQPDTTFGTGGIVTADGSAGVTNGTELGYGVAIDGSGRILISGESVGATTTDDMALWRYK